MKKAIKGIMLIASTLPVMTFSAATLACGGSDSYLATMCVFAGNFAPRGYALAQGQLLPISQNTALFSLLGTTYGGDGRTTFALPDTRGRALIGVGAGPGLSHYLLGQKGGVETVQLTLAQTPSHTHNAVTNIANDVVVTGTATLNASNQEATSSTAVGNVLATTPSRDFIYASVAPNVTMNSSTITLNLNGSVNSAADTHISNAGGSQSHENRAPYIAVNWIIAIEGLFPSRN